MRLWFSGRASNLGWPRVRLVGATVTGCAAVLALAGSAVGAAGDLDPIFGSGGKVTTDFGGGSAAAVAIQADAKVVAAGSSGSGRFALGRFNTDGSLDTSFGSGGKVTTEVGGIFEAASAVAIQANGKIVAAGGTAPGGFCCEFALVRYNSDGSLDTSFGSGGKVTTSFGGIATASAVAIQTDGKIIAAGGKVDPFGMFALARYNSDGSLDTSFGSAGKVITSFGGAFDGATGVGIQVDGKVVAAGAGGPGNDFLVARYNTDGSLDTSFGSGGKVTTDFGGFDSANAIAVQADGKVVAAGVGGFFARFALARYNADGGLDASFGSGGMVTTQFFGENIESANAVAIQQNGKIVVAGRAFSQFDPSYALARYHTDGSLDTNFGSGGKITTDFGNPSDVGVLCPPARKDCSEDNAADVAIQPDGKILAVGGGGACVPACTWTLARYLGDPSATTVSIDIRPGSSTNPIKLSHSGLIPVAILTTDAFNATTIDPSTVCFGDDDNPSQRDCTEAHGTGHIEDVNGDGRSDLVLHYEVSQTGIDPGDTTACLSGKTFAGVNTAGCDSITTL